MYECHLTYENTGGYAQGALKRYANENGWKFSAIDGDPALGAGTKLYLTCHDTDLGDIFKKMRGASTTGGLPTPVREKIEHIVHDPLHGLVLPNGAPKL